ncbi:unnamed protein product [Mycena citricolor]|uniref:HhH-GPD domain-containing protein n=1 Tax=Mycena citricolor TaxID=2018698 RepID=A0AAD2GUU8_9AGAR|nr:unnamed protein product [Mycena citricolor]
MATRRTRLQSRTSPYDSTVTLFKLETTEDEKPLLALPQTPRRARVKTEPASTTTSVEPSLSPKKRAATRSPTKSRSTPTKAKKALAKPDPEPEKWREVYDAITEMRSKRDAPVDTMGCHTAQRCETDPRTPDQVTGAAVLKLQAALGGSVSLEAVLAADIETIRGAVNKVGMWPKKSVQIKAAAELIRDNFNGDVPQTIEELMTLPGVGPKVGFLTLQAAWQINVGIGVDVHVHRITQRLGWHHHDKAEDARYAQFVPPRAAPDAKQSQSRVLASERAASRYKLTPGRIRTDYMQLQSSQMWAMHAQLEWAVPQDRCRLVKGDSSC